MTITKEKINLLRNMIKQDMEKKAEALEIVWSLIDEYGEDLEEVLAEGTVTVAPAKEKKATKGRRRAAKPQGRRTRVARPAKTARPVKAPTKPKATKTSKPKAKAPERRQRTDISALADTMLDYLHQSREPADIFNVADLISLVEPPLERLHASAVLNRLLKTKAIKVKTWGSGRRATTYLLKERKVTAGRPVRREPVPVEQEGTAGRDESNNGHDVDPVPIPQVVA